MSLNLGIRLKNKMKMGKPSEKVSSGKKLPKSSRTPSLLENTPFHEIWPNLEVLSEKLLNFEKIERTEWQHGIGDIYQLCGGSRNSNFETETDLYENIKKFTETYVENLMKNLLEYGDENLFQIYSKNWTDFKEGTRYVNILFDNFNKTAQGHYAQSKIPDTVTVLSLFHEVWSSKILKILQPDLIRLTQQAIERDRHGQDVSLSQIANVVDSFIELSDLMSTDSLNFYRIAFELPFFTWTEEYYKKMASELCMNLSCSEYMNKVSYLMDKERDRSKKFLHSTSVSKVVEICQRILVEEKLEFIMPHLKIFIETESLRDLSNMYVLIKPSAKFQVMVEEFEKYTTGKGLESIKKTSGVAPNEIVRAFFDGFTTFHEHYSKIIRERFSGDVEFVAAFDRACAIHVNYKADKEQCSNASRFLNVYVDRLLRKSSKLDPSGDELEQKVSSAMTLFRYIEDKDIFQRYFCRSLALRLIHSESSSMDAEASMIGKLKLSCGYEFVRKPQQMFNDVNTSKETNSNFADFCNNVSMSTHKSLYLMICQFASWPLNTDPGSKIQLPEEFVPLLENFDLFYKSKFTGRKLIWLHHLSKVDVMVKYLPVQYVITMDFYQACVLMIFNALKTDSVTLDEIHIQFPIDLEQLNSYLKCFVSCGLLIEENITNHAYKLNSKFRSSHKKFNIKAPQTKKQVENEVKQVNNSADQERRLMLECKIVQIMKMRQVLKHTDLITETIKQTSSRFPAQPNLIKQVIENLIEKEYLERSEENRDEYKYKA